MKKEVIVSFERMSEAIKQARGALFPLELPAFFSVVCVLIDEYAVKHDLDTMDVWDHMHRFAKEVNDEMGDTDYIRRIK